MITGMSACRAAATPTVLGGAPRALAGPPPGPPLPRAPAALAVPAETARCRRGGPVRQVPGKRHVAAGTTKATTLPASGARRKTGRGRRLSLEETTGMFMNRVLWARAGEPTDYASRATARSFREDGKFRAAMRQLSVAMGRAKYELLDVNGRRAIRPGIPRTLSSRRERLGAPGCTAPDASSRHP